jgi:hypothetical protein
VIVMDPSSYEQLKDQLSILIKIRNPHTWIKEAIKTLHVEITRIENRNRHPSQQELQIIIPKINTGIRIVTHINAANSDYTFTDPYSFVFTSNEYSNFVNSNGRKIQIGCWKDVLEGVCNLMKELHPNEINRVFSLRGRTRIYFTPFLNQLSSEEAKQYPRKIKNTNIYLEHNYSANIHVERCYQIIELFSHKRMELNFITIQ